MALRHVVMFRWSEDATPQQRAEALAALRRFSDDVADLGRVSVGPDAGLVDGNFDAVAVVELADADAYRRYAQDPRHVALVARYLEPIVAARAAVQYELGAAETR